MNSPKHAEHRFGHDHDYDTLMPEHIRDYLAQRKTDLVLNSCRDHFGSRRLNLLDAGCGTGRHVRIMRDHGHEATGVDVSPDQIERARNHCPGGTFLEGDILGLPFENESFDAVTTINTLHHLKGAGAQHRAVKELARVTRRDGLVIVHEMNIRNPVIRFYLNKIFPRTRAIDDGTECWVPHTWWEHLKDFEVLGTRYFNFVPDFTPRAVFPLLRWISDRLDATPLNIWSAHLMTVLRVRRQAP